MDIIERKERECVLDTPRPTPVSVPIPAPNIIDNCFEEREEYECNTVGIVFDYGLLKAPQGVLFTTNNSIIGYDIAAPTVHFCNV